MVFKNVNTIENMFEIKTVIEKKLVIQKLTQTIDNLPV